MDDVLTHSKRMFGSLVRLVRRADIGQLTAMRASVLIPVPISKGQQMLEIHRSHRSFTTINVEHALPHICRGGGDSSSFKAGWPAYWFVMQVPS